MSMQVSQCACGRDASHKRVGLCHPCYQRDYEQRRRTAGRALRSVDDWFDRVVVQRAWGRWLGFAMPPPGRKLTSAERRYLCYVALTQGYRASSGIRELIGTTAPAAERLCRDILSGAVQVWSRDWLGQPLSLLPAV